MPVNNIVTDKGGLASVIISGGYYVLRSLNETPTASTASDPFSVYINENNLVQNNLSPGEIFYYRLYQGSTYETGFGEIINSGVYTILNRKVPDVYYDGQNNNNLTGFYEFEGPQLFLQVSAPPSVDNALAYENSVLCTSSSGTTNIVPLQNNTLMGCKDDSLQSIDGTELVEMFGNNIPVALEGKSISCAALNLYSIRLLPSGRPLNPPRGTIIYNDQSNVIEFYNGNSWSTL